VPFLIRIVAFLIRTVAFLIRTVAFLIPNCGLFDPNCRLFDLICGLFDPNAVLTELCFCINCGLFDFELWPFWFRTVAVLIRTVVFLIPNYGLFNPNCGFIDSELWPFWSELCPFCIRTVAYLIPNEAFLIPNCGLFDPNRGLVTVEETIQQLKRFTCGLVGGWQHGGRTSGGWWGGSAVATLQGIQLGEVLGNSLMEHKSLHGTFHQISVILREKLNFQLKFVE
jgi:hypothetical protein